MLSTRSIGTITEYECAVQLMQLGCIVSKPLDESSPYDLIADYCNHLIRIQVKHSTKQTGGFEFSCQSTQINSSRIESRSYSSDCVDYFGTIYDRMCYLVPISECKTQKKLRIEMPKNFSLLNVCWAVDYEAEYQLRRLVDPNSRPRIDMNAVAQQYIYQKFPTKNPEYKYEYRWITDGKHNCRYSGELENIPEGFRLGKV